MSTDRTFCNAIASLPVIGLARMAMLALAVLLVPALLGAAEVSAQTNEREVPAQSLTGGEVPGAALGTSSDAQIWRAVRKGLEGEVSIPNKQAGVLIQSEGDNWRAWRNGPITVFGAWAVLGIVALLALFFALRGRIKIDAGPSGRTVERFTLVERTAHWMTAISFIVLALTGLNLLYGRHALLPLLGKDIFAAITTAGKLAHNYIAFAFMLGIVIMAVLWIRHNFPNRYDVKWVAVGGGLFKKGVHPPAKKFNAGQKLIFWAVVLGGISISVTGLSLLFPFELPMFAKTFQVLNIFGLDLPADLTIMQEMQLAQLWHSIMAMILIALIIAHIYIGSVGMEGAFAAMSSGQVDENWAREHHSIWLSKLKDEEKPKAEPAE